MNKYKVYTYDKVFGDGRKVQEIVVHRYYEYEYYTLDEITPIWRRDYYFLEQFTTLEAAIEYCNTNNKEEIAKSYKIENLHYIED